MRQWRRLNLEHPEPNAIDRHPELRDATFVNAKGGRCTVLGVNPLFPSSLLLVERPDGSNYSIRPEQIKETA